MLELKVPDIGGVEVPIIEVHIKEGATVRVDDPLITLESDKASMDIPSIYTGTIEKLMVKVGDKVSQNQVIALISQSQEKDINVSSKVVNEKIITQKEELKYPVIETLNSTNKPNKPNDLNNSIEVKPAISVSNQNIETVIFNNVQHFSHASPSVRKLARELGISNIAQVKGSGLKNRITHDDIKAYVKQALQSNIHQQTNNGSNNSLASNLNLIEWPQVDFAKFGAIEQKALSRIQKLSGANLHRNWVMIPHVTNNDEADITELEKFRKKLNNEDAGKTIKITLLAFLVKAVVVALKKFPTFNSSLVGDDLILKKYFNIGFAADTPNGLVVPVIKNVDNKGIIEIANEINDLAQAARNGTLKVDQMQGGCFSISSLGAIGGTTFTPIINAPEVAILGVCKAYQKAMWCENKQQFVPRLTLPLSLSWDHRVIDGVMAGKFNAYLGQLLSDYRRISL